MSETGSVKFSYELIETELAPFVGFDELNVCRRRLQQLRLLGVDESGIGFGNVSVRDGETTCLLYGTARVSPRFSSNAIGCAAKVWSSHRRSR